MAGAMCVRAELDLDWLEEDPGAPQVWVWAWISFWGENMEEFLVVSVSSCLAVALSGFFEF